MSACLLTWNPRKFNWKNRGKDIEAVSSGRVNPVWWSCGNTKKKIATGDQVYLIKLGEAPKGIIGRGVVRTQPTDVPHWDPDRKQHGETVLSVEVDFDDLRYDPAIPFEDLVSDDFQPFVWSAQRSGVQIPGEIVEKLQKAWPSRESPIHTNRHV
jgi:hypothetical protein